MRVPRRISCRPFGGGVGRGVRERCDSGFGVRSAIRLRWSPSAVCIVILVVGASACTGPNHEGLSACRTAAAAMLDVAKARYLSDANGMEAADRQLRVAKAKADAERHPALALSLTDTAADLGVLNNSTASPAERVAAAQRLRADGTRVQARCLSVKEHISVPIGF